MRNIREVRESRIDGRAAMFTEYGVDRAPQVSWIRGYTYTQIFNGRT